MYVQGHVSMMLICNANGVSLPPLYVFSGKILKENNLEDAPEGHTTNVFLCHVACFSVYV